MSEQENGKRGSMSKMYILDWRSPANILQVDVSDSKQLKKQMHLITPSLKHNFFFVSKIFITNKISKWRAQEYFYWTPQTIL